MWTIDREMDFVNNEGAAAMQSRMSQDLVALTGLGEDLAASAGTRVIAEKGYAVEALCVGALSRMHYDLDILVATPDTRSRQALGDIMLTSLNGSTGRDWQLTPQKRGSWVKFHEVGVRQWDDGVTGTKADRYLSRQIDVHIVHAPKPFHYTDKIEFEPKTGVIYEKPVRSATLTDTFGNSFTFETPTVSDIAATKVRLIRPFDIYYGNTIRSSDFMDFQALFESPDFSTDEFLELLGSYYASQGYTESETLAFIGQELVPLRHLLPVSLQDRLYSGRV